MSLVTRCPKCNSDFVVKLEQLQSLDGLVRCGACSHIFDGFATLQSQLPTLTQRPGAGARWGETSAAPTLTAAPPSRLATIAAKYTSATYAPRYVVEISRSFATTGATTGKVSKAIATKAWTVSVATNTTQGLAGVTIAFRKNATRTRTYSHPERRSLSQVSQPAPSKPPSCRANLSSGADGARLRN